MFCNDGVGERKASGLQNMTFLEINGETTNMEKKERRGKYQLLQKRGFIGLIGHFRLGSTFQSQNQVQSLKLLDVQTFRTLDFSIVVL